MWTRGSVVAMLLLAVSTGCAQHTVGPARTADDYQRKARTTASHALSAVETVRLLAETSSDGRSLGSYTSVSLSEQEDVLTEVSGDFRSIQPPDDSSDDIRTELDEILADAIDHVATVRIAARRGQLAELENIAAPLAADSSSLRAFLDEWS